MPTTSLSSREFNQDIGRAKKAAKTGPVIITDRGKPSHVLLTMEEYQKLSRRETSLVERLAMPGLSDLSFEPGQANISLKVPDLD